MVGDLNETASRMINEFPQISYGKFEQVNQGAAHSNKLCVYIEVKQTTRWPSG